MNGNVAMVQMYHDTYQMVSMQSKIVRHRRMSAYHLPEPIVAHVAFAFAWSERRTVGPRCLQIQAPLCGVATSTALERSQS
jgi:hypothetical protein